MSNRCTLLPRTLIVTLIGLLLALTGCAARGNSASALPGKASSSWGFDWLSSKNADLNHAPQVAFDASARAETSTGALQKPVNTTWLVTGTTFATILVQLDAAGQHVGLVELGIDAYTHQWTPMGSVFQTRPGHSAQPRPAQWKNNGLILPADAYQGSIFHQHYAPKYIMKLWLSATQTFATGRFVGVAQQPASGSTHVTIDGQTGWLMDTHGIRTIVVPLSNKETFIFVGRTTHSHFQALATQGLTNIDHLLPLSS